MEVQFAMCVEGRDDGHCSNRCVKGVWSFFKVSTLRLHNNSYIYNNNNKIIIIIIIIIITRQTLSLPELTRGLGGGLPFSC